jgi:hypothetical protein
MGNGHFFEPAKIHHVFGFSNTFQEKSFIFPEKKGWGARLAAIFGAFARGKATLFRGPTHGDAIAPTLDEYFFFLLI